MYGNRTHALFQDPEDSVTFTTQSTYQYNIRNLFLSIFNSDINLPDIVKKENKCEMKMVL